jgi:hypothetical protein
MKRLIRCVTVLLMFSAPAAVQAVSDSVDGNSERCPKTVVLMGYWPQILITTSRGGSIGWEVEAVAGGHGSGSDADPSSDWRSDDHGEVMLPTRDNVDAHQLLVATLAAVLDAPPTDCLPCPSSND